MTKIEIQDFKARIWTVYTSDDANMWRIAAYLDDIKRQGLIESWTAQSIENYAPSFSAFTQLLVSWGVA